METVTRNGKCHVSGRAITVTFGDVIGEIPGKYTFKWSTDKRRLDGEVGQFTLVNRPSYSRGDWVSIACGPEERIIAAERVLQRERIEFTWTAEFDMTDLEVHRADMWAAIRVLRRKFKG